MKNERILVIGGTGALGTTLTNRYYDDNEIMVLSRSEHKQEAMKVKYPNVTYRLGDVKDKPSLVRNLYEFNSLYFKTDNASTYRRDAVDGGL